MKLYLYDNILFSDENLIDYLYENEDLKYEFEEHINDEYGSIEICGVDFDASDILNELAPDVYEEEYREYINLNIDEYCVGSISCERFDINEIRLED